MKIFFLGDIFGKPGRNAIADFLPKFKQENNIDLCIANCENISDGKGIAEKNINELTRNGIDIFSSGNHLWDRKESYDFIKRERRIAKPLNYPKAAFGFNYVLKYVMGTPVFLVSICGQAFMSPVDSPFYALKKFLKAIERRTDINSDKPKIVIVDFHAESTAEKRAFGLYFDGKVTAILGTHTHVQTADEEILDKGTAYITDVGMCGPHKSVIGITLESSIIKFLANMPTRYDTATEGLQINAVLIEVDTETAKATNIIRIKKEINL